MRGGGRHADARHLLRQRRGGGGRLPLRVRRGRRALGPLLLRGAPAAGHAHGARRARRDRGPSRAAELRRRHPGRGGGHGGAVPVAVARRAAPAARGTGRVSRLRRGARGRASPRRAGRRPGPSRRRARRHRPVLRLRPLAPAHRPGRQRGGARALRWPRRRGRSRRGGAAPPTKRPARGSSSWRRTAPGRPTARTPGRWWPHRAPGCRRPRRSGRSARRSTRHRSARRRTTSAPATSSRWCCRSGSTSTSRPIPTTSTGPCACSTRAPTCTSCASPRSPWSARRPSPWCACATASSSRGRSPARGHAARTSSTTGSSKASWPRTPRSWPSTSCWWTWPATTSGASSASAPRRSTSS